MATVNEVKTLLNAFGYKVPTDEDALITMLLEDAEISIMTQCNVAELPSQLDRVIVYRAAGAFLEIKASTASLYDFVEVNSIAKKIVEGDTTIEYAVSDSDTPTQKLNKVIKAWKSYGIREVNAFRRMRW